MFGGGFRGGGDDDDSVIELLKAPYPFCKKSFFFFQFNFIGTSFVFSLYTEEYKVTALVFENEVRQQF